MMMCVSVCCGRPGSLLFVFGLNSNSSSLHDIVLVPDKKDYVRSNI